MPAESTIEKDKPYHSIVTTPGDDHKHHRVTHSHDMAPLTNYDITIIQESPRPRHKFNNSKLSRHRDRSKIAKLEDSFEGSLQTKSNMGVQHNSFQMERTDYEPDLETSFKMPAIPRVKVSPNLVKKSQQLNKIFQMKNSMEKAYGEAVKHMTPIK